jgi:hypothetical protein
MTTYAQDNLHMTPALVFSVTVVIGSAPPTGSVSVTISSEPFLASKTIYGSVATE